MKKNKPVLMSNNVPCCKRNIVQYVYGGKLMKCKRWVFSLVLLLGGVVFTGTGQAGTGGFVFSLVARTPSPAEKSAYEFFSKIDFSSPELSDVK
ncbi:MAG: hypothetical protein WCG03_07930, partial [Kiritimatiellales bacterium]